MGLVSFMIKIRYSIASNIFSKNIDIRLNKPIISFTFDDVPSSTADNADQILKKYKSRATFYITGSFVDKREFLSRRQVAKLIKDNHEVGGHTFSHLKLGLASGKKTAKDIDKNKRYFKDNFNYKIENFAYPYGSVNILNKNILREAYDSSRSNCPGLNSGKTDITMLKACRLYSSTSRKKIDKLIKKAVKKKAWLIFYTHDIKEDPSRYGCTPDLFEYAVKASSPHADISTVKKALKNIRK